MENGKNKELQSRREFFKKAAKAALPVVGAIVLANVPATVKALDATECHSCSGSCYANCQGGCKWACQNTCKTGCKGGAYDG